MSCLTRQLVGRWKESRGVGVRENSGVEGLPESVVTMGVEDPLGSEGETFWCLGSSLP